MITLRTTDYAKITDAACRDASGEYQPSNAAQQTVIRTMLNHAEGQIEAARNPAVFVISPARQGEEITLYNPYSDQTQQYVGVLYYKDNDTSEDNEYLLQIHSRFDDAENNLFFKYLIERAFGEGVYFLADNLFEEGSILPLEQLLAVVFMRRIHNAFKKGVYRKYRTYEQNDPKVRGTIDVAGHIRQNLTPNGRIAYSYRELTADNEVNRLIFSTYKMMEKRYPWLKNTLRYDQNVREYVAQMSRIMTPASRSEIHSLIKKSRQKVTHPLYREWDRVRQIALMILRHMDNFNDEPGQGQSVGFLVDMNRAWEIYLEKMFGRNVRAQNKEDILLPRYPGKSGYSALMKRTIRPDFCWYSEAEDKSGCTLVLDAKNRPDWEDVLTCDDKDDNYFKEHEKNKNDMRSHIRNDIYQVFSYMLALHCNMGGIVCPSRSDKCEIRQAAYRISDDAEDKLFTVLGLPVGFSEKIDDEYAAYTAYAAEMKRREEQLIVRIHETL